MRHLNSHEGSLNLVFGFVGLSNLNDDHLMDFVVGIDVVGRFRRSRDGNSGNGGKDGCDMTCSSRDNEEAEGEHDGEHLYDWRGLHPEPCLSIDVRKTQRQKGSPEGTRSRRAEIWPEKILCCLQVNSSEGDLFVAEEVGSGGHYWLMFWRRCSGRKQL